MTHIHIHNGNDGVKCFLSIILVCFPQSTAAPWEMPSKTRQGTADIFVGVDLEFRSKASLQACTP